MRRQSKISKHLLGVLIFEWVLHSTAKMNPDFQERDLKAIVLVGRDQEANNLDTYSKRVLQ